MKPFLILIITFSLLSCNSSGKKPIPGATEYQKKLNMQFKDASRSPLKKKDLKNFNGLDFFKIDSSFIVEAAIERIQNAPIFEMATNTTRKPLYRAYGILSFTLKGSDYKLTIYQSEDNLNDENNKDLLFLPFTDNTSGNESYGGGRYMDVLITDISTENKVILNFNNTYNPYCAYNENYSCPISPRKNHLDIEIKAGVKVFNKH